MLKAILIGMILSVSAGDSWIKFQSNLGYEIQYPGCWNMAYDAPDAEGDFKQVRDLVISEGEKCKTKPRAKYIPNSISINFSAIKNKKELEQSMQRLEKEGSQNVNLTKKWLLFKKFDVGGGGIGYRYVEDFRKEDQFIRWKSIIYCSESSISTSGPHLSNPSSDLVEKIKSGDFSIPDPEKKILESFKCTDAKK